jgi:hypothetical protein
MLSLSLRFSGYYNILYIPFTSSNACYTPKHLNYSMGYPLSSTFPRYKSVYLSQIHLSHTPQLLKGQVSHPYFFDYYFATISHLLHAENVMIQWASSYRPFLTTTLCVFRIFPMHVTYPYISILSQSLNLCNFARPLALSHSEAERKALTIRNTRGVNTGTWEKCVWDRRASKATSSTDG